MNRRQRKRIRLAALDYAHRYLGVKRLPNGVPAMVKEWAAAQTEESPSVRLLQWALNPYRKPWTGL